MTPIELALALLYAPTEDAGIAILKAAGYWEDSSMWKPYGDNENNYSTIGNQQSSPDAALVERVVNSIDSVLIAAVTKIGIDPQTSREAVEMLFPDALLSADADREAQKRRVDVARLVQVSAMGVSATQGDPCIVVADQGEGIQPCMFGQTILSLGRSNKLRVPYVQGKFNMGGSGSLKFSGRYGLQVIVSRRDPKLTPYQHESTRNASTMGWGVTVLRREDPGDGRRSSVYTYLAPTSNGMVLCFDADEFNLFPDNHGDPFGVKAEWGTVVKMFDYQTAFKQQIPRQRSLKERLEILMPRPALPFRIVECRPHYWKSEKASIRSLAKTLVGVERRLEGDATATSRSNVEHAGAGVLHVTGPDGNPEEVTYRTYLMRAGKGIAYRQREGVVFSVGGQTQGTFTDAFFQRKAVGLSYLKADLLVVVDGSSLSGRAREDLFMNSRDRLSDAPLRYRIERALEEALSGDADLAHLRDLRRRAVEDAKLQDERPIQMAVEALIGASPSLRRVLVAADPRRATQALLKDYADRPERIAGWAFEGAAHPTFVSFRGSYEEPRAVRGGSAVRFRFETDAADEWLTRQKDRGHVSVSISTREQREAGETTTPDFNVSLSDGNGVVTLRLPALRGSETPEGVDLHVTILVEDTAMSNTWTRPLDLVVGSTTPAEDDAAPSTSDATSNTDTPEPTSPDTSKGKATERSLAMPEIRRVREKLTEANPAGIVWADMSPPFTGETALRIVDNGTGGFDFFVNVDNSYVRAERRFAPAEADAVEAKFVYGLVLFGMSMLRRAESDALDGSSVEDLVERTTSDIAPVLLPMIDTLSKIESHDPTTDE